MPAPVGFIRRLLLPAALIVTFSAPALAQTTADRGVLLLAHGGSPAWNDNVRAIADAVNRVLPTEVAFGMATRANIQAAVDRLTARAVRRIVAVPLFVSSHSSVITSTEFLLGLRSDMPADLAIFARMSHGGDHGESSGHQASDVDGTTPVTLRVPIAMAPALDAHPLVAAIALDRARSISQRPAAEAVILVAHGPQREDENDRWLANLRALGRGIVSAGFASLDAITVRDDAPREIRDRATADLRALVERRRLAGHRVLVVPVLLSFGGIEKGVQKRLDGLDYAMADRALAPDDRLVDWVLEMARKG